MRSNSRAAAVLSYITWLGFLTAFIMRDPRDRYTAHHMNQALVLNIAGIIGAAVGIIPVLGTIAAGIVSLALFVFDIIGVYRAATGSTEPLPLTENIHLIG